MCGTKGCVELRGFRCGTKWCVELRDFWYGTEEVQLRGLWCRTEGFLC